MNDSNQSTPFWKRHIQPAFVLWLIAPVFGEMISGSTPLNEYISTFIILIYGMLYGSGTILIREAIIHWRKGWASLLLLGMAYGIYEEGLVVRSFFDPGWVDLEKLGVYGRALGVNWVWAEHLTIFHAVISVAASIVFVEMLYPNRRAESWVGTRGLTWNIIALIAMLPIGSLMSPYNAPDVWLGICWLAIALLILAARYAPAVIMKEKIPSSVTHPRYFFGIAFIATVFHFFIVYFTAEWSSPPFIISMLLVALFNIFILWLVLRWNGQGRGWDDRHRLAFISGALSFFLVFGLLTTNGQNPVMYFSNPVFLVLLWWVYRRVSRRVKSGNGSPPNVA